MAGMRVKATSMLGPIRTRDVKTTLAMLYVQYDCEWEVIKIREVSGGFEIYVQRIGT